MTTRRGWCPPAVAVATVAGGAALLFEAEEELTTSTLLPTTTCCWCCCSNCGRGVLRALSTAVSRAERVAEVPVVAVDTTAIGLPPLEVEREFERRMRCGITPPQTPLLREVEPVATCSRVRSRAICGVAVFAVAVVTTVAAEIEDLVKPLTAFGELVDCCCCCSCIAA